MNFDPKQETQEEYLRRVSLKDKINNEEWKKHDQEEEDKIIIFKKENKTK